MYDHYIGLDWAQSNMAIARMSKVLEKVHVIDVDADITELIFYLKNLKGKKILTFEETNTSQWLYTELRKYVDKIVVCDPYRNKLLSEGAKTDKLDAIKLVKLLRSDLLKPVYHSANEFIYLRTLVSGYEDSVQGYVRATNQRQAVFRSNGKNHLSDDLDNKSQKFVAKELEGQVEFFTQQRKRYEEKFALLCRKHKVLKNLMTIPGIAEKSAVKLAARIVDINRFESDKHLWSYCGLIKYEKMSGGRSYGKRSPRFSRSIKALLCTSTMVATQEKNDNVLKDRYEYLIRKKRYSDDQAKVATRRLLASIIYGVMKSGKKFDPGRIKTTEKKLNLKELTVSL